MQTNFLLYKAAVGKVRLPKQMPITQQYIKMRKNHRHFAWGGWGWQAKPCLFNTPKPGTCFGVPCTHAAEGAREGGFRKTRPVTLRAQVGMLRSGAAGLQCVSSGLNTRRHPRRKAARTFGQ